MNASWQLHALLCYSLAKTHLIIRYNSPLQRRPLHFVEIQYIQIVVMRGGTALRTSFGHPADGERAILNT